MLIVENDIIVEINNWLKNQKYSKVFILIDENTNTYCLPILGIKKDSILIEIESGEVNKNLSTCQYIWNKLLQNNADRNALLINLGGGVICDMGGFCASTYKRGIDFINIPTTLLAQVDASIGSKTGIDFANKKNMIGLFSQSKATFIDSIFLNTLPQRELLSGFAEVLKHGLIADKEYFRKAIDSYLKDSIHWNKIIDKSIQIKANIVAQDPLENGLRKILNFGHTIGHALESYSLLKHKKPLLHGEAVILGIIGELFLSKKRNLISQETLSEVVSMLKTIYTFDKIEKFDFEELINFMLNDKKNDNEKIQCILLKEIGLATYGQSFSEKEITDALLFINQNTQNA
ncbi:MAG: 3-dehydroquinate synthase [Chitinophagales bacterium]